MAAAVSPGVRLKGRRLRDAFGGERHHGWRSGRRHCGSCVLVAARRHPLETGSADPPAMTGGPCRRARVAPEHDGANAIAPELYARSISSASAAMTASDEARNWLKDGATKEISSGSWVNATICPVVPSSVGFRSIIMRSVPSPKPANGSPQVETIPSECANRAGPPRRSRRTVRHALADRRAPHERRPRKGSRSP